ncbi:MAG: DoxX family protein [Bacteroidota bacterium]
MFRKILFWGTTGLFTLLMLFSVYNYFFNTSAITAAFESFGYPTYLIYPLAIAKLLGLVALWGNFSEWLKEWAYAGFFFNSVLAFFAHYMIADGQHMGAVLAFIFVLISYFSGKTVRP